jgi:hypothetical protein
MDIGIRDEPCTNPVKQGLTRYVMALLSLCAFLAGTLGYHWAWEVFETGIFR